jgi:hypothetical protein
LLRHFRKEMEDKCDPQKYYLRENII